MRTQKPILYLALCFAILQAIFLSVAVAQTDGAAEPVTKARILRGLKIDTEQSFMAKRVSEQGVDFRLTREIENELKNAGANEDLIAAIRTAKVVPKIEPQAAVLVINTDADCTVDVNGTSLVMKAGESRKVAASVGDNVVRAVSQKDATISWRKVIQVEASEQKAVLIELQALMPTPTAAATIAPTPPPIITPTSDMHTQDQGNNRNSSKAVQTRLNPKDGLTYVWIPPGKFKMGCSPGDGECSDVEKPAHSVTITKGFWMGQTAVTQAAYQRVVGKNPSYFHGDQLPVDSVDWDHAANYCSAVGMRLPTEAEWEYAGRAGSTASRYGDIDAIAWYGDNSGNTRIDGTTLSQNGDNQYQEKLTANGNGTHSAAQKQPNAWMLYDMLGNVWQWTADWYDTNYYSQSPSRDPRGPTSGRYRLMRGGCWYATAKAERASYRTFDFPGERLYTFGFRCAGDALP